jgi:stearoyl-CoA desaturase (delta-9 desaturase)
MALEGSLNSWCARHRQHHQTTDKPGDPHSPLDGKWHAHFGFLLTEKDPDEKKIPDLVKDPMLAFVSKHFLLWSVIGLLLPPAIAWAFTCSIPELMYGFLWGSLVRVCIVHHVTWSINSVCHLWGTRAYNTDDLSRNNFFLALLSFGEGFHNNHHADQHSARHGFRWWEFDVSWYIIRTMEICHLATAIKHPNVSEKLLI